jgi:hypothetical protein
MIDQCAYNWAKVISGVVLVVEVLVLNYCSVGVHEVFVSHHTRVFILNAIYLINCPRLV